MTKNRHQTSDARPQENTHALPDTLQLIGTLDIQAAKDDQSPPKFSMLAYTGGAMMIAGFSLPVVVDLAGLTIERQTIPVRQDHDPTKGVGHTTEVTIHDGQITAAGVISRDTSWARDVANSGKRGFPWQASIGAKVFEYEYVPADQSVLVNGQSVAGDIYVVRKSTLKEISFVDSAADADTNATIEATLTGDSMKETEKNKVQENTDVKACGCGEGTPCETCKEAKPAEPSAPEKVEAAEPAPAVKIEAAKPATIKPAEMKESNDLNASADEAVTAMRQRVAAESRRITQIQDICAGDHAEICAKAIESGWDINKTKLEVLQASRPSVPAAHIKTTDHSPKILEATALMASGFGTSRLEQLYDVQTLEAADKLRTVGIQEFCEIACGMPLPRFRSDSHGWLQAAFSTASLPGILSNIANKMLLEGYNYIEDAWRQICKIASVNDFKEHSRYRLTGNFTFEKVGADGELKHGKLDEMKFGQKADTHGIMFALTRQMIINDDMGAFTDIPRQIGMGAAEAIADAVWSLLLSNPSSFFSAGNKNYLDGADTALSVDALTAAEILFSEQTKPNGRPLGVTPKILLVPVALKVLATQLMKSLELNETTTADKGKPNTNPHVGKFDVVSSAYMGNASFTGASSKAWYLFADPNRLPAMEVAFLNGVDRPTVEKTDADFNTLGIQFRGFIDFGVREQDYRGANKMKGEA